MAETFFDKIYKSKTLHTPDVLSCLANLSNDEVFTPPDVVNKMLDLLPQELFSDPNTTFLDPACKTGVFLREIAKRLLVGLQDKIPDLQQRIDHIFHKQLFGIAITELTSLLSRRSLYCSKYPNGEYSVSHFDSPEGNIRYRRIQHTWVGDKCKFCGASKKEYDRGDKKETHAYEFIHTLEPEKIFNMKFDVIISNPPYQLSDGGQAASAKSIYQLFVMQYKKLNARYISMIIPARWYANGKGQGMALFRQEMLDDDRISHLVDFKNSEDCFPGVNIAGGVCYFLWEKDYHGKCEVQNFCNNAISNCSNRHLNEFDVLVRDNVAIEIIRKVRNLSDDTLSSIVQSYSYFSIRSFERGTKNKTSINDVILLSSDGKGFYPLLKVIDKAALLDKYKVIITYAMSGGNKPASDGKYQVISSLQTLNKNEVCTETYLILGAFIAYAQALNMESYIKTRFFRFLLLQALTSIHITKDSFQFVPMQDFTEKSDIDWSVPVAKIDKQLYKKYNLTQEEIDFIESMIKPME